MLPGSQQNSSRWDSLAKRGRVMLRPYAEEVVLRDAHRL